MIPQQLEVIAANAVEASLRGEHFEDDLIDLKSDLPDPENSARRLAAHANAALGRPVIWILGIDPKAKTLTGLPKRDSATWLDQLAKSFHGQPPELTHDLIVTLPVGSVRVWEFQTLDAPYLVKAETQKLEVPWRDGTRTRSATRLDLLRLLVPRIEVPELSLDSWNVNQKPDSEETTVSGRLLVLPPSDRLVFAPYSGAKVTISGRSGDGGTERSFELTNMRWGQWTVQGARVAPFYDHEYNQPFVWAQRDGIYVAGPGLLDFIGGFGRGQTAVFKPSRIEFELRIGNGSSVARCLEAIA
jgi:hypothetical protein